MGYKEDKKHIKEFNLAKDIFDRITENANVKESDTLFEMIVSYLNGSNGYFNVPANISRRKFTMSIDDFRKILNRYRYETDDISVYKINWLKYITHLYLQILHQKGWTPILYRLI